MQQDNPQDEKPVVVDANNLAVKTHLESLWKDGLAGMQSFIVDGEVEVWKIDGSQARMVFKIRKMGMGTLGDIGEWEKTRDFNFDFSGDS